MNMPDEMLVGLRPGSRHAAHEVKNQARPATGYNAFLGDVALTGIVNAYAPWAEAKCVALGDVAGDPFAQELAHLANQNEPELRTHDAHGNRTDWVHYHPAWHRLMQMAFGHEVHSLAWTAGQGRGHFARAVLSYLWNQIENGVACPVGMTYASVAGFNRMPTLATWREKMLSTSYDPRRIPLEEKTGAIMGYAMTEKQGGSDLRETQTSATYLERTPQGDVYLLTGHKWFCSVPIADGFFTLARTSSGVSCFFVPRILPDGSWNRFLIQRLKDKCGNRSNASSEIEYDDTWAILVGEEGHGIREILSHAHLTRLDFAVGSAGLMRQALTLALNHAQSRTAFGKPLAELPMQLNVLAEMSLESESAMLSALRAARATDGMHSSERESLLARVATPVVKFWNCQRAPYFVYEAMQVHGGNGFVMENAIARLYREAPLNSIWEGTSNMMCMDVLRVIRRERGAKDAFMAELEEQKGRHPSYDRWIDALPRLIDAGLENESAARMVTTRMALALQAGEMLRHSSSESSELFVTSRLGDAQYLPVFGSLPPSSALPAIVRRATVIHQ